MKELIKGILIIFKFDSFLRNKNRRPRVLFWHGVDNDPHSLVEAESIDIKSFKKQVSYLRRHFEIISIEEFYHRYINRKFNGKEVVLTFDDGYKNNLTVLAPYFKSLNIPFTVFISTNNIENGNLYPTSLIRLLIFGSSLSKIKINFLKSEYEIDTMEKKKSVYLILSKILKTYNLYDVKLIYDDLISNISQNELGELLNKYSSLLPMNWEEVKKLSNMGATIGSHCMDHICCHNNQNDDEINRQIINSKKIIESKLDKKCDYFAYPNGDYNECAIKSVKSGEYKMGFTTKNIHIDYNHNQLPIIPRVSIPFNLSTFKLIINK